MNYDEMSAPKPFRWRDNNLLLLMAYIGLFMAGFLFGMIAVAWVLVRLLP